MKKLLVALLVATSAIPTYASVLLTTDQGTLSLSVAQNAGRGQFIEVSTNTHLDQFGFYISSVAGGNLKFFIANGANNTILWSGVTTIAANTAMGLVMSPFANFDLTTTGGTNGFYKFGVIADKAFKISYTSQYNYIPNLTQNGLSIVNGSPAFTNYANPAQGSGGDFKGMNLVITGTQGVPEPAMLGLFGLGVLGLGLSRRRKA